VVIDDFDLLGASIPPYEAEAPLVIDPDAVLTRTVSAQRLQPISGWSSQIAQFLRIMNLPQFSLRRSLDLVRQPPSEPAVEQSLGLSVGKRTDHPMVLYTRYVHNVKRS
jgi:hypothetical protein